MSSCECPAQNAVTFANGVVLLRCSAHDRQSWFVDGRPADRADALPVLRDVFAEQRGRRPARTTARPSGVPAKRSARSARPAQPLTGRQADDALTAMLRARGLQGDWAIA